jgi:hypothetical protein
MHADLIADFLLSHHQVVWQSYNSLLNNITPQIIYASIACIPILRSSCLYGIGIFVDGFFLSIIL